MALVALSRMLADASANGYAVGYFEAWDGYSLEAVAEAAEAERAPVVLGFGGMVMEQEWLDRCGIEPLGAYGRVVAERLRVPAAFILNEVWEWEHAVRGIEAGFNVVMLNTCHLPYEQNLELTRGLVERAHRKAVEVQAELGRLPDFGDSDPGELTDPVQAREFVQATGVDFLAVSVGNIHQRTVGASGVDLARVHAIRDAVGVPLVIHGGSGLDRDAVGDLIRDGISLFHVGTVMKMRFVGAVSPPAAGDYQAVVGSRKDADFLLPGKRAVTEVVRSFMRLYGSSGKAV
jgi:fructose/tagatose bisphosphate aldolase